jgi:NitT/TauT family transport system substrate-binding protein
MPLSRLLLSRRGALVLSSATLACAALSGSSVPAFGITPALFKIAFALNRGPYDASNAPFLLAERAGFFQEEGIEPRFSLSRDAEDALHRVASSDFDFAFLDCSVLLRFAFEHPQDAPVYIFTIFDSSPASAVTWKSAGVRKPSDLRGKVLAAVETDGAYQLFASYLQAAGVPPNSVALKMTALAEREKLMLAHEVDGAIGFDSTIFFKLQAAGVTLNEVDISYYVDGGLNLYSNGIVVSRKMLKDNPARIAGVVRACARGWRDALRNPDGMLDALSIARPDADRTREAQRFAWIRDRQILTPAVKANGLGLADTTRLARVISQIAPPNKTVRIDQVYSAAYLPPLSDRSI